MGATFEPSTESDIVDVVQWCIAEEAPIDVIGAGTKRGLGRPVRAERTLDTSRLAGVERYEPEELFMTAKPATRLAEVEDLLAAKGQQLAFEPPDYGPLLGTPAAEGTLGGAIACNLSGPRRVKAGAARDHLLGANVVTGRGEAVKFGGIVVKNVTGYDVCKLLCGSFGTLAVMTALHVKVLPAPESETTLLVMGLDDMAGTAAIADAMGTPNDVSGAAHLPAELACLSAVETVARAGGSVSCLRLDGIPQSIAYRVERLRQEMRTLGDMALLDADDSRALWREVRDVSAFARPSDGAVWRICVPPDAAADVVARIKTRVRTQAYYDWAGGLIWLRTEAADVFGGDAVRDAVGDRGHATLIRADAAVRDATPVFQPQPPALKALTERIKSSFDPRHILNPGRMYAGV
jgi:glycolate oxidase FAD binding subunit